MSKTPKSTRSEVFRERLRAAMLERKLNRTELAERTGVDRSTVSPFHNCCPSTKYACPPAMWWQSWHLRWASVPTGCWV